MFSLTRFSKMDLRPTRRSTYGIGHRCEKSAVGMGRRGQWQSLGCFPWRNVQQGDIKVISLVPSGNMRPFPKPLQEETKEALWEYFPSLGELDAVIMRITLNTPLAGTHNEGKPRQHGFCRVIHGYRDSRTPAGPRNLAQNGPSGIASRRGTRHIGEETPTLEEWNEPVNLGISVWDAKAPRSANAPIGRRSNRSSLSRASHGPYTKGCSKVELQVAEVIEITQR